MIIFNLIQLAVMPFQWVFKFFMKQLIDDIDKNIIRQEISLIKSHLTFLESQIEDMQFKILHLKICLQNTEPKK